LAKIDAPPGRRPAAPAQGDGNLGLQGVHRLPPSMYRSATGRRSRSAQSRSRSGTAQRVRRPSAILDS